MAQQGVKYHNLFEYLNSKAKNGDIGEGMTEIKETDYRDALNVLEEENMISLVGHKRMPTIRFVAEWSPFLLSINARKSSTPLLYMHR